MRGNIAVLMTVHNRKEKTLECIRKFYNCLDVDNYEIDFYMMDDGCTDGTPDAVSEEYPNIIILHGDGTLFWNRGMYYCWKEALIKQHDFYLWLNDDTFLYKDAIRCIFNDYSSVSKMSIISGCCCDTITHSFVTYGGWNNKKLVLPNGHVQKICEMNGNFVLIPSCVCEKVGIIDPYFLHAAGDNEYGYRCQNHDVGTFITSQFVATCDRHDKINRSFDPNVTFLNRLKYLNSPFGPRPKELFYLYAKSFGMYIAIKKVSLTYARVLFPTMTERLLSFRNNA